MNLWPMIRLGLMIAVLVGVGVAGVIGSRLVEDDGWDKTACKSAVTMKDIMVDQCQRQPSQLEFQALMNGSSFQPNEGACIAAAELRVQINNNCP